MEIIEDLEEIINELNETVDSIEEIYLFGSRGYDTGSINSDIDLLCFADRGFKIIDANRMLDTKHPAVDLFVTSDKKVAFSASNGSSVSYKAQKNDKDIIDQLDAILLWSRNNGFNKSFTKWEQKVTTEVGNREKSILPERMLGDLKISKIIYEVEKELGVKPFFSGSNNKDISETVVYLVDTIMKKTPKNKISPRAENFKFNFSVKSEYDFQNMIMLALRPIFPDIERETPTIVEDGNKKTADFSLVKSSIIIEAKWIDDQSKKNQVVKTLNGLSSFYTQNSNVKALLFLIGYEDNMEIDCHELETKYSSSNPDRLITVKFFKNIYNK